MTAPPAAAKVLHDDDQDTREKYAVIFADSIFPMVAAGRYMDGKACELELQQLLGELSSAHDIVKQVKNDDDIFSRLYGGCMVVLKIST